MERKELEAFLGPGKGTIVAAIIVAALWTPLSLLTDPTMMIGVVIVVVLILLYYIVPAVRLKKRLDAMEMRGDLLRAYMDFKMAQPAFGGKLLVGNEYLFGKKVGGIIPYWEISKVYQYIHRTNFVEDNRLLKAVLPDGKKAVDVCKLPRRGKGDAELAHIIEFIQSRNPAVHVGYR
ncbi:MAG: hypothetical protein HUJ69_03990 [Lachnospiraceae bacterium]|nr:hypothetical protein [Lachnospiraceae bacterium]